ncbi:MAG: hypothetical protein ABI129_08305 [Rhodanobacter sp.]
MHSIPQRTRFLLASGVVLVVVFVYNSWVLDPRHFFYADDWGWLTRSQFAGGGWLLHLLPHRIYNDRPGGGFIIKFMYEGFGLRYEPYNLLWLLIHVANCGILLLIARTVMAPARAMLAALLAGCWSSTLTAAAWIGGVFDLVGATWCLLALLLYIHAARRHRGATALMLGALVFHVVAIRTKEFALALIVLLAVWDWLLLEAPGWRARLRRLAPHAAITAIYVAVYLYFYLVNRPTVVVSGAYQVSISAGTVVENLAYYLTTAFYLRDMVTFQGLWIAGLIITLLAVAASLFSRVGRASLVAAISLLAVVLLLGNQRSPLYLYAPHFFLALALCSTRMTSKLATALTTFFVCLLVAWPWHTRSVQNGRNFVLSNGAYSQGLFDDYKRIMQDQPPPTQVTIAVTRPYFDPFTFGSRKLGPGDALRIYYRDESIKVDVIKEQAGLDDPCATVVGPCLRERSGHLVRVK